MAELQNDPRLQKALEEFQQYLSDVVPPMIVADSVELLMEYPPKFVASHIYSWVSTQYQAGGAVPVSDYFFHAIKKLHMLFEYKLIPPERFLPFFQRVKSIIVEYCPADDQDILRINLERMGDAPAVLSSPVEVIYRQTTGDRAHTSAKTEPMREINTERLDALMQKLERGLGALAAAGQSAATDKHKEVVSEALAEAARGARVAVEMDKMLDQLKGQGIQATTEDVFRALGRNLPGWLIPDKPDLMMPEDSNLKAMHRIVTETKDPREGAERFHQMIQAAVERFNEGQLAQAASMMDLAQRIIAAKEVAEGVIENVRRRGDEHLDPDQLRKYAESPDQQPLLRKVMNFYFNLTPQGLMDSLRQEQRRERRRLLLVLLEAHGAATRMRAVEELRPPLGQNPHDQEIYYRRNLMYLLRRIPAAPGENLEEIVDLVSLHTDLKLPSLLVKEAIAILQQLKHEKSEQALIRLLESIEFMIQHPEKSVCEPEELQIMLDRVIGSLARLGTAAGWRTVVDRASSKKKGKLGDTMQWLSELSSQDLSSDMETVERLVSMLKAAAPSKLFGIVRQKDQSMKYIIEALSSTPLPKVRRALEEVVHQMNDKPAGAAANKALANIDQIIAARKKAPEPQAAAAPSLQGDLELFALPSLLQSLADTSATGSLVLKNPTGEVFSTIYMEDGRFRSAQTGPLSNDAALYQVFEWPSPGAFQFTRGPLPSNLPAYESREVLPLMLEGMRRYDELQQYRSTLPDDSKLKVKATHPPPMPEEKDGLLFRDLWTAVRSGATPKECDAAVRVDSYRVRRLLVHWLDSRAIVVE